MPCLPPHRTHRPLTYACVARCPGTPTHAHASLHHWSARTERSCGATSSLEKAGDTYGVIKIVPPQGWAPPLDFYASGGESVAARRFSTKAQSVNHLRKCKAFGDGKRHTVTSYARAAFKFAATQCVVVLLPAPVSEQVGAGAGAVSLRFRVAGSRPTPVSPFFSVPPLRLVTTASPAQLPTYPGPQWRR